MTTLGSKTKVLICPYCGDTQAASERCRTCGGLFEPLSRQASHNAMGPWYVRSEQRPFQPGASYETIVKLVERSQIDKYSIIRGPTTKQFWTVARRVPGIAHLLGYCHNCDASVGKDDHGCPVCGVPFGAYLDRNYLGLPEVKPLPWEAPAIDNGQRSAGPAFTPMPGGGGLLADLRRAAEPLGLSSFASDAELRGIAARAPYAPTTTESGQTSGDEGVAASNDFTSDGGGGSGSQPRSDQSHSAAVATYASHDAPRSVLLDSSPSGIAARSMQRRLQQQRSTIRLLMLMMGLVTIVAIVVIAVMITRLAGTQSAQAVQPPAPTSTGAAPSTALSGQKPDATRGNETSGEQATDSAPLDQDPATTTLPHDENDAAAPAVESTAGSIEGDHERAVSLLVEAKREDRPLKDRIKDCEQAAALLKGIKARVAVDQRPADLEQQIIDADRLLERLKLQEFFP